MTAAERRASGALASIFALRMLGLFLVLPVFALEASRLPGGDDAARVGLAMGLYGLTQALLQIPFGLAADRLGRKPVIIAGLLLFALGSALAAWAPDLTWLTIGRALQGAGAISAAVTAFLADVTRDGVRTKAMAVVGASIALMFALSLALAPPLAAWIGLSGIFVLTCALALLGIAVVIWVAPPEPPRPQPRAQRRDSGMREVLRHAGLLRLNLGVFVLHAVQLAMWMAVPALLLQAGLAQIDHWLVYLPAVLASLLVMGGVLFPMERRGHLRAVFLAAIGLILLVQLALWWLVAPGGALPGLWSLGLLLFVFFIGFNTLEASQPSLVSKLAPTHARGAALGVYNTLQSIGFFLGGALGGWLVQAHGPGGLFAVCAAAMLVWLLLAWPMQVPASKRSGRA
ncbi:MFS transporter [Hydrogenophaga sp.]|uniref:MFS transporter n=1 Tax=Hydrogenophaga sp. TaxID=1904254 RepID=UPI0019BA38A4|nr:MFS transporter [Hydrogenophaga sp.]MBD3893161.1 MFS transporter [Hydrogenophaga sp.]